MAERYTGGLRHFSLGVVTASGVECSSRTGLTTRRAAHRELPSLQRRAAHEARRSRSAVTVELVEHIGSCRGCRPGTGLGPGCQVLEEQRVHG